MIVHVGLPLHRSPSGQHPLQISFESHDGRFNLRSPLRGLQLHLHGLTLLSQSRQFLFFRRQLLLQLFQRFLFLHFCIHSIYVY